MPRILVLNDTRDQPNWGSQACAQKLIDILEARVPDAVVTTLPSAWLFQQYRIRSKWLGGKIYRAGRVGRIEGRVTKPYVITASVVDDYEAIADGWSAGWGGPGADEYIAALREVDAVVFNAEGSTYRANHVAVLALFMLWFARERYGVPAFFLNGTVAFTDVDRVLPGMARKAFPVLDGIAVREPMSVRNVGAYVPGVDVRMVPDSVFACPPDLAAGAGPAVSELVASFGGRPYFVLSSSMLPVSYLRTPHRSALVALVRELKKVVPGAVLAGKDDGDQWLAEVARLTDSHFFGPEHSYADLAALLESAVFLVSGRYHNIILGSIVGCPSVALTTTSPKIDGLCELVDGLFGRPFDVTDLWSAADGIVAAAADHLERRESRRGRLLELTTRFRAETAAMGDIVQTALSASAPRPGNAVSQSTDPE